MKVNDIICGFQIRRVRQNQELGGTLWEMTHLKTNAESNEVKVHIQKDTLAEELEKLLIV